MSELGTEQQTEPDRRPRKGRATKNEKELTNTGDDGESVRRMMHEHSLKLRIEETYCRKCR